jgi:hypothetical protein
MGTKHSVLSGKEAPHEPACRSAGSWVQGAIHVRGLLTPALSPRRGGVNRRAAICSPISSTPDGRKLSPLPESEGQGEKAPTVVALGTLEPKTSDAPDWPQRAGTRRRALADYPATPAPPSPLNGERAGVRGETTKTRRSVHGEGNCDCNSIGTALCGTPHKRLRAAACGRAHRRDSCHWRRAWWAAPCRRGNPPASGGTRTGTR